MRRLLLLAIILGCILRIVPYWASIFAGGYVNFASPDSYYHINLIVQCYNTTSVLPHDATLYHIAIADFARMLSFGHSNIHFLGIIAIFMPVLFFALTVPLVYFIGNRMFSSRAGVVAAFFFALMPGCYLTRSVIGEIDYHALEVLMATAVISCMVHLFKSEDKWLYKIPTVLLAFSIFAFYCMIWPGGVIFIPVALAFIITAHKKTGVAVVLLSLVVIALFVRYLNISPLTVQTTAEAQPGYTAPWPLVHIVVAAVLLLPFNMGKFQWPVVIWSLILIVATLIQLRFDYYLIVPLALLIGMVLDRVGERFEKVILTITLTCALVTLCLPGYILLPKLNTPSPAWHNALEWVSRNTPPDALIISWWDYGYWIRYLSQRRPYVTPSQEQEKVKALAKWFINGNRPDGLGGNAYIVVDSLIKDGYIPQMKIWAGDDSDSKPFILSIEDNYQPVYNSGGIEIFKVGEGK